MNSISLLIISTLAVTSSISVAETRDYGKGMQNFTAPTLLDNVSSSLDHWQGIGRLRTEGVCTATLLDTRSKTGIQRPPAYVLTAGHCINLSNGRIDRNAPISGTITFNYFKDGTKFKTYDLKKVKWRSMQGVDMAIVELSVSLQTLISHGIQPLKLARATPAYDSAVLIVGAPQSSTLELAACTLQPASDVIEGVWTWRNNFMTRCKGIQNGSSGSPLLDRYSNEIIGVVGTGNQDPTLIPCEINAPCTFTGNAYSAILGNVYGNPVAHIRDCFFTGFMVENFCELYPTFNIETDDATPALYKNIKIPHDNEFTPPVWNYKFSIDTAFFRHKTVSTAKMCESPEGYSTAIHSANAYINDKIGTQPGRYFLCIIGTSSAAQEIKPGLLRNALSIPAVLTIDESVSAPDL